MFVGLDLQYRPLRPSRTCRFLTVGEVAGARGTFYGRCTLGDANDRAAWISRLDRDRLHTLQTMRLDLARYMRSRSEELWRLKGEQLRAQKLGQGEEPAALKRELEALCDEILRSMEAFIDDNAHTMRELGMPKDALVQATLIALEAFVRQPTAEQADLSLPDDVLNRFSPEVRALILPPSATEER
jgi:hypothetical protein